MFVKFKEKSKQDQLLATRITTLSFQNIPSEMYMENLNFLEATFKSKKIKVE